jgi:hypothetical protein
MPGKKITAQQIRIYMKNSENGSTKKIAAAQAGFSERSGYRSEHGQLANQDRQRKRLWKGKPNPFEEIWESHIIPMLKKGIYESTFILRHLQEILPGKFAFSMLRTLQRKVKLWNALCGSDKEVILRQNHEPGKLGISDFTHPKDIKVTIQGKLFKHIFYHFRLAFSHWSYVQVFRGSGEPFDAFSQGLQEALLYLAGAPKEHRTDSLSASFKNLSKAVQDDLTQRYKAFVEHYGMKATRINPGKGHENGAVESAHRHFKDHIRQSLILRGNNDFATLEDYRAFIMQAVKQLNERYAAKIEIERQHLLALPATKAADYIELTAVVSSSSTVEVRRVTYTVPSRLIGERLLVRLYTDRLECYLGRSYALTLERVQTPEKGKRAHSVNYRHVIGSLIKKPGGFRGWQLHNDIFPNENYKYIWEHVDKTMGHNDASKFILGLLHLAATENCEDELAQTVITLIKSGKQLTLSELQNKFRTNKSSVPVLTILQHSLSSYNKYIPHHQGASYG